MHLKCKCDEGERKSPSVLRTDSSPKRMFCRGQSIFLSWWLLISVLCLPLAAQTAPTPLAQPNSLQRPRLTTLIPPSKGGGQQSAVAPNVIFSPGAPSTSTTQAPVPPIQRPVYTVPKPLAAVQPMLPPSPNLNGTAPAPVALPNVGSTLSAAPPLTSGTGTMNTQLVSTNFAGNLEGLLSNAGNAEPPAAPFRAGELICVVGEERILAGDLALYIEPTLEQLRSKLTENQQHEVRAKLMRQALPRYVETKALYQAVLQDVVGRSPLKDQKEARQKVLTKASQVFHDRQVQNELKRYKVDDIAALEAKLRERNFSLAMLQNQFIENVLANQVKAEIPQKYDIERDRLWQHYHEHQDQWKRPATVRWRQLTARFDKQPTRQATEQLINEMFAEVFYGGKRFEIVAQQKSQGHTASKGGVYDWTTQGSLKSKQIEQAIFTYEIAKLSPIIEDELGLHIVEVLERKPAYTVSFEDAQSEISKLLSDQRREEEIKRLHDQILKRTVVWTRWPEDIPGSRSLQAALGENSPEL